jgi:hypothetical protein
MEGKYIYGIVTGSNETILDINGLGNSSRVYTIGYNDLNCLLSDYHDVDFSCMPKERIIRNLLRHEIVVEHVMKKHMVLPIKFGTILATLDEVRNMLCQGYSRFMDALALTRDKVEVEVAATWDTAQVLQEISKEKDIVSAKEAIASKPAQQDLRERSLLGQMVKASMDRRRDSYREQMIAFLKPVAVDVQPNALVSDQMVMNVAFLVEKANQEKFDRRIGQLNDLFHNQINFRIVGPLPPYSFAMVEVTKASPDKLREARQLLQLGETSSEPDIRKAYRRLAAETHPDCNPGKELATKQFAELRQASELLIAYCRGRAESGDNLLINIRRLRDEELLHLRFAEGAGVAGVANG